MAVKPPTRPTADDEWETVDTQASAAPDEWETVEDGPEKSDGSDAMATGGVLAGLAGAMPIIKRGAEHLATSPALGSLVKKFAPAAGALNVGSSAWDVVSGRKSMGQAVKDGAVGEGIRQVVKRAPSLIQRVATPVAGMSVPFAAGGLAGLAGTAGFLGALQHDANRHVDTDYSKNTPDTDIAKVLMNMRNSEANSGRSLDARMDDPNDVMFKPDDSATVTGGAAPPPSLIARALQALLAQQ